MLNSLSLSLFQFVFFPFMSSSFCEKHKKTTFLNLVLSFDSVWYFLWSMIHLIVFRFHNNSFLMKISHKWLSYSFSLFHVCIVSRRMERRSHGMQEQMKTKNVKRKKKTKYEKTKIRIVTVRVWDLRIAQYIEENEWRCYLQLLVAAININNICEAFVYFLFVLSFVLYFLFVPFQFILDLCRVFTTCDLLNGIECFVNVSWNILRRFFSSLLSSFFFLSSLR